MILVRGSYKFQNKFVLDEIEENLFNKIKNGQQIPTGSNDKNIMNALTRLRRNGYIKNFGTRSKPEWKAIEEIVDDRSTR